jgi:hypothetical protein
MWKAILVRMRRPLHALTCSMTALHHAFELGSGVGLVFQPQLGLAGSFALWGSLFPAWFAVAARGRHPVWDRPLALAAGMSLAGVGVHYAMWPWELRRGVPFLTQAEGLRPRKLPAYNAILYAWAAAAMLALLLETPRGSMRWAVPGVIATIPLSRSARRHFVWIRDQAVTSPAWWNRAFAS